jgi:hypothetical protein
MATSFSTLEALSTLCKSVPEWNTQLDDLNGQIANRQIELARLTEKEGPPPRSLKNKGSTESLRPKDDSENPFGSNDPENGDGIQMNPVDSPKPHEKGSTTPQPRSSTAAQQATTLLTSPQSQLESTAIPRRRTGSTRRITGTETQD